MRLGMEALLRCITLRERGGVREGKRGEGRRENRRGGEGEGGEGGGLLFFVGRMEFVLTGYLTGI